MGNFGGSRALNSKLLSFTRDLTAASGSVAYTGVGFQPSTLILLGSAVADGTDTLFTNIGLADAAKHVAVLVAGIGAAGKFTTQDTNLVRLFTDTTVSNLQVATVSSYDVDGFTLAWSKIGLPTGTGTFYVLCLR